jgi:glucose-6-phosphate 1-dehydrogenase
MKRPENLILVIFGASGDLTYRKLIPGLYSLKNQQLLPERFAVLGVSRSKITVGDFRKKMREGIISFSGEKDLTEDSVRTFTDLISYIDIDVYSPPEYEKLKNVITEIGARYGIGGNYIFYTATPPAMYEVITENLSRAGFNNQNDGFRRFIIEKPFGYDLESARSLNRKLHLQMSEDQIYRIDHYLGKESVQNLLVTRFANGFFEPLWNRNYVHRVEITSAENLGIENRGGYYETAGALRDMVQNHLLQLVGLTAMEPPSSMDPNAIRNEVLKVFQSLQILRQEDVEKNVVRGQYIGSRIGDECIGGYRQEKGVDRKSRTETYVAIKFFINNWRWGGVPFYIRTGKRLPTRVTEIVIYFNPTPHSIFRKLEEGSTSNQLILRIQPDEGILLKFGLKEPGQGYNIRNVNMNFHYKDMADIRVPLAYERLLYDVMTGDSTLFQRDDEVEASWMFVDQIQKAWKNNPSIKLHGYAAGTWGPEVANNLIDGEDLTWRYPCKNLVNDGMYCEL